MRGSSRSGARPMTTILVVDDDDAMRKLVVTWLQAEGYKVFQAPTARHAIALVQQSAPDLILMDVMLPDMTGFAATQRIRAFPGFRGVPVIALTGLDMRIDVANEAGCTDVLLKPVERHQLLTMVKGYLKKQ